jgi:hypothetical protein
MSVHLGCEHIDGESMLPPLRFHRPNGALALPTPEGSCNVGGPLHPLRTVLVSLLDNRVDPAGQLTDVLLFDTEWIRVGDRAANLYPRFRSPRPQLSKVVPTDPTWPR